MGEQEKWAEAVSQATVASAQAVTRLDKRMDALELQIEQTLSLMSKILRELEDGES